MPPNLILSSSEISIGSSLSELATFVDFSNGILDDYCSLRAEETAVEQPRVNFETLGVVANYFFGLD